MEGLYALKPWYAGRLVPIVEALDEHRVSPNAVSVVGVLFGGAAGAVLAWQPPGPTAAACVAVLLAARLACANVDGTLARRRPADPAGGVTNELGDRAADLLMLAGFVAHLGWPGVGLMLAATLPSWASLAVAAQGGPRSNAGPAGKTERCVLGVLAACTGWFGPVALVMATACALTAVTRLRSGRRALREAVTL